MVVSVVSVAQWLVHSTGLAETRVRIPPEMRLTYSVQNPRLKTELQVVYGLSICVWQWSTHPRQIRIVSIVVPILNLELAFNFSGLALSLLGMSILLLFYDKDSSMRDYIALNHLLITIAWTFCLFWSRFFTSNTVSNLFINEWGRGTDDIEIEALEGHF
ncbi:unnamed protein product [Nippostrongylus brasiliensis]|uniref:Transmembrane protein n=1 Tax=Nippostrongylus brasiliensis TaxID=27835 RepID=A0A0N4YF48_NIPBR|nr:unnamed protein product [Nippostrongylus brasiliensis]